MASGTWEQPSPFFVRFYFWLFRPHAQPQHDRGALPAAAEPGVPYSSCIPANPRMRFGLGCKKTQTDVS